MKITIISDLHLESGHQLALNNDVMGADALLLAGDVCIAEYLRPTSWRQEWTREYEHRENMKKFFYEECAKYPQVYYILGNHEHYHGVFDHTADIVREFLKDTNVTLLDKQWVDLPEISLYGATMWTDYDNNDYFTKHFARKGMSDHEVIAKIDNLGLPERTFKRFHPNDALVDHIEARRVLEEGLAERTDKNVLIMTHHAPTAASVNEKFKNNPLNGAFYSNLEDIILNNPNIEYWFHGHMHDSITYEVGGCTVMCNPRGYPGNERRTNGFVFDFTVDINGGT